MKENKNIQENQRKPHLYSFVNYVYQTLINENKDQVVNMLGQIGAGKTFNLVHIIEYLCHIAAPESRQAEIFDVIHKSIQMVHMLGSIFRQNNMESTSCGMLLKLSFNEQHQICGFDLDAKILDVTLPFSENGRSFSILHSLMTGASKEIKKLLDLPENESYLNFFRKFLKNFDDKTKERFKLNDLEIWNRFHSLLNCFKFTKTETVELMQLMAFILLLNEASISKKKTGFMEEYILNKGPSSKKLAKNLNISEEEFLKRLGSFKEMADIKNSLIAMMKYTYYMIFEFVKLKLKTYLKSYFEPYGGSQSPGVNHSFSQSGQNIKSLYFIDFPGEVEDQTLGGLSTNLANECLNVFAGSQYLSVVNKLQDEALNIKHFQPLHSYHVIQSLIGRNGMFSYLSNPFTEENFKKLKNKTKRKEYYQKTTEFNENISHSQSEFLFNFKFSHKNVPYNYESLYLESKGLLLNNKILKLYEGSKNSIVRTVSKSVLEMKSFYDSTTQIIKDLFKPLEGLNPFVIYCLHSNNSLRIFFGDNYHESNKDWFIPKGLTIDMLRNSLTIPVLYWEWFGYHEWIEVNIFVKEFSSDFEKIKERILKTKSNKNKTKDISFKQLNPYEISTYILSVLGTDKQYILGTKHIILKKGTLKEIHRILDNMNEISKTVNNPSSRMPSANRSKSNLQRKQSVTSSKQVNGRSNSIMGKDAGLNNSKTNIQARGSISSSSITKPEERRRSMKVQCHLDMIDGVKQINDENGHNMLTGNIPLGDENSFNTYSLFKVLADNKSATPSINNSQDNIITSTENEITYDQFKKDNNIVVPKKQYFNIFKNLFDYSKIESFDIFDYNEYTPEINRLQTCFRAFKARKKYKIYRYAIKKIMMVQRFMRGIIIRKKFKKFLYANNCILFIQRLYRMRHDNKINSITKIQALWRGKMGQEKLHQKVEKHKRRENGENDEYNDSSFDELDNYMRANSIFKNKTKRDFESELLNVSIKTDRRKSQSLLYVPVMSIAELEAETDKNKIVQCLMNDNSMFNSIIISNP